MPRAGQDSADMNMILAVLWQLLAFGFAMKFWDEMSTKQWPESMFSICLAIMFAGLGLLRAYKSGVARE